jgi:hypothetical protein
VHYALVFLKKLFSARGLVAVFGLLIVGLTLLIIFVPDEQPTTDNQQQTTNTDEIKQKLATLSVDSDNDGLKDWEEPLYKTDPQNPDTDGDGTNDGDEIKQNRDPLKKGPNDKVAEAKKEAGIETAEGPNLTAELMGTLIQGGVLEYLAQGGDPDALPDEFYSRIQAAARRTLELNTPTVLLSELRVISDSSDQAIKNYFNALGAVYEKYIFPLQKDDLQLFQEILESQDITRFAELDPHIRAADISIAELKKTSVPQIRAEFHKKEIEILLKTKAEISVLRNTDNDPLATLIAVPRRITTKQEFHDFHVQEMRDWLAARSVTFKPNEKAALLLRAYQ